MRLKNIVIVVKDIETSKQFYRDVFGLIPVRNQEGNVILTEGLVLQDETVWKSLFENDVISHSNSCELYFEERDLESFADKLERLYPYISYSARMTMDSSDRKVIRFYDPDGHLIEVGTPSSVPFDE